MSTKQDLRMDMIKAITDIDLEDITDIRMDMSSDTFPVDVLGNRYSHLMDTGRRTLNITIDYRKKQERRKAERRKQDRRDICGYAYDDFEPVSLCQRTRAEHDKGYYSHAFGAPGNHAA